MTFAAFLVGLVGPLTARVLMALGMSVVTVGGLAAGIAAIRQVFDAALGGIPGQAVGLIGLMGGWEAIGLIFGSVTFVLTWKATAGFITLGKA